MMCLNKIWQISTVLKAVPTCIDFECWIKFRKQTFYCVIVEIKLEKDIAFGFSALPFKKWLSLGVEKHDENKKWKDENKKMKRWE